jgi:uncharacterized protein
MISLRVDDDARGQLQELASARDLSLSEVLRELIDDSLGRSEERESWLHAPASLSRSQRLTLSLLHSVLAELQDTDAEFHEQVVEILQRGYAGDYDRLFLGLEPELSRAECSLVWDILDMFRTLAHSLNALPEEIRDSLVPDVLRRLHFGGFDGNHRLEGRMLGYLHFLMKTDRWAEFKERLPEIDGGNSHMPLLPSYERMLAAYRAARARREAERGIGPGSWALPVDDLREIAEAWPHPDAPRR